MSSPIVNGLRKAVLLNSSIAASQMFTATDADDAIAFYYVQDYNLSPGSGYFSFNGVPVEQGKVLKVAAADLNKLRYVGGNQIGFERFRIFAQDVAGNLSNVQTTGSVYSARPNTTAPWGLARTFSVVANERIAATQIVSGWDPDGHPIESFSIRDRNNDFGHFELNGIRRPSGTFFTIDADQLSQLYYVTTGPTRSELFDVIANDGAMSSPISVGRANSVVNANRPIVRYSRVNALGNEKLLVSNHLDIVDADGNSIKQYRFFNTSPHAANGNLIFKGVIQPRLTWINVSAEDVDKLVFDVPNKFFTQLVRAQAFDGKHWSAVNTLAVTSTFVTKPTYRVSQDVFIAEQRRLFTLPSIVQKLDTGTAYTSYEIYDPNMNASQGYFIDGITPLGDGVIRTLTPEQFANTGYVTGAFENRSLDTFYVRASNEFLAGNWKRVEVRTEPEYLDVLGVGRGWDDLLPKINGKTIITFSYMQQEPTYGGASIGSEDDQEHFETFDAVQRANTRLAFRHIEEIANVLMVEIADTSTNVFGGQGGLIRIGEHGDADAEFAAFAYFPSTAPVGGDMWYNRLTMDTSTFAYGSSAFTTFLHELGHSMAMKHPHEGTPRLPASTDFDDFSVMSYNRSPNGNPTTYQLYDIYRLQSAYGANNNHAIEDNVYSIAATWNNDQRVYKTIWDGGGNDTLSAVGSVRASLIDLRGGQASTIGVNTNNVYLAFDTVIENAIGSNFDDRLIGNQHSNFMNGGLGNDYLFGGLGDDFLRGGAGNDTIEWGIGDGNDMVFENGEGGLDTLRITQFPTINALEDDFHFRLAGNDLIVNLTLDNGDSQGSFRIKDQTVTGNEFETLELGGLRISLTSLTSQATAIDLRFQVTTTNSANGFLVAPA